MTKVEGKTAAEWANNMAGLRASKPRPLARLYGTCGPTPEQAEAHARAMKEWNRVYRRATKNQKAALALQS